MRYVLFFVITIGGALVICAVGLLCLKYRPMQCEEITQKAPPPGCTPTPNGTDCLLGDLAPESWGTCLETSDGRWACIREGHITIRDDKGTVLQEAKATDCPALAAQITKAGRDKIVVPVIPWPPEPEPAVVPKKTPEAI